MAKDICWVFRVMAGIVYSETYHALKHPRFALQEETITEMLLLRLSRRFHNSKFDFRAFTKPEEGKITKHNPKPTGADFEFWFTDYMGNQIKLRVQAKRQFPSGKYDLDPTSKQISFLVKNCGDALPIYLFYNIKGKYDFSAAPKYSSGRNFASPSYWGCSYALASDVLSMNKNPGPADFLKDRMWPWHTLVCDQSSLKTIPQRVSKALNDVRLARSSSKSTVPSARDVSALEELEPQLLFQRDLPTWFDAESWEDERVTSYLDDRELDGVVILNQSERSE